jgi:hypothetical protein
MAANRVNGVLCPPACQQLLPLADDEFERAAAGAIARLEASASREAAIGIYDDEVFPLEMERVRREAVHRAVVLDLLFVTVGAQAKPPTLAILASPARFVVLLHTEGEKRRAEETVQTLGLDAVDAALELVGDGKDPLELYRAIFDRWTRRGRNARVGVDITGGLKVMSAAGASACFAIAGGATYYIDADRLRVHGLDCLVRERRIELANPFAVFGEIRRATGRELLRTRRYAAAAVVYGELLEEEDRWRKDLAEAYDALERLDVAAAKAQLNELCVRLDKLALDPRWKGDAVLRQREAIRANAEGARRLAVLFELSGKGEDDPLRNLAALRSKECLDLGEMLLARAEHARPDVAVLLAYRCLELVPQRRLAVRGNVDPSAVDWGALAGELGISKEDIIGRYNAGKKNRHPLDPAAPPAEISSTICYRLLDVAFPGDVTEALHVDAFAAAGASRNRSLFAHGLQQLGEKEAGKIRANARRLLDRLLEVENVSMADRAALRQRHTFVEVE